MRLLICLYSIICISITANSQNIKSVSSPNRSLTLNVSAAGGKPVYSANYKEKAILEDFPLGLITNERDFSEGMSLITSESGKIDKEFTQAKIKQSFIK